MKFVTLALAALWIVGCSSNYGGEVQVSPAESQKQLEDQIKKYENDPHMPPQAKAAAIAAVRRSMEMGKGMNLKK